MSSPDTLKEICRRLGIKSFPCCKLFLSPCRNLETQLANVRTRLANGQTQPAYI